MQQLIRVEHTLPVRHDHRILGGSSPARDQNRIGSDLLQLTLTTLDLDRVRVDETRHAIDGRDAIPLELRSYDVDFALQHDIDTLRQILRRDVPLRTIVGAVERPLPDPAEIQDRLTHRLARNRAEMQ